MQQQDIVAQLAVDPTEILYAVRMEDLVPILINRLGEEAIALTVDELCLIRKEVLTDETGGHLMKLGDTLSIRTNPLHHWKIGKVSPSFLKPFSSVVQNIISRIVTVIAHLPF